MDEEEIVRKLTKVDQLMNQRILCLHSDGNVLQAGRRGIVQKVEEKDLPQGNEGLINPYTDRIDRQAIDYFHQILNDHLQQITYPAREALGQAIQQSAEVA